MKYTVAQQIASAVEAMHNCISHGNEEWRARHEETAQQLTREHMPSGSGIDTGTTLSLGRSHGDKLVFLCSFHHMNEHGYYDGWTEHTVTVRPAFRGLRISISGRDRNQIKDYLHEVFSEALR